MKKRFTEAQIVGFQRGGRCGAAGEGPLPQARVLGGELLPVAEQIRRMSVSDAKRLKELEVENTRLKKLLAESLLENEVTCEVLRKKW
jgi:putative transposase